MVKQKKTPLWKIRARAAKRQRMEREMALNRKRGLTLTQEQIDAFRSAERERERIRK